MIVGNRCNVIMRCWIKPEREKFWQSEYKKSTKTFLIFGKTHRI